MKDLVEIVPLNLSSDDTIASSVNFLSSAGFSPILASKKNFPPPVSLLQFDIAMGRIDGYIYDRLFEPMLKEAYFLLEEGATAPQIDDVLRSKLGIAPFQHVLERGITEGKTLRKHVKDDYTKYREDRLIAERIAMLELAEKSKHKDARGNPRVSANPADPAKIYKTQPGTLPDRQNPDPDEPAPVPKKRLTSFDQWYSELPHLLKSQTDYITGIKDPSKISGHEIIEDYRIEHVSDKAVYNIDSGFYLIGI